MSCTIYVVRHGESTYNRDDLLAGHHNPELTEQGKQQAQAVATELADVHFDEVYTSDLQRAIKTAELIYGRPVPKDHQLVELRERSFAHLEGTAGRLWRDLHKSQHYQLLTEAERWVHKHHPAIESNQEIAMRYLDALRRIAEQNPGKTLLLVGHGGGLRATLIKLGFATVSELPPNSLGNAAYAELIYDGHDFRVGKTDVQKRPPS